MTKFRLLLAALAVGALVFVSAGPRAGATGSTGEAIIKCSIASTTAIRFDPILNRTGMSGHNHIFFGNTNIEPAGEHALATGDFSGVTDTALEPPGNSHTTCADAMDGTAQWFPELFYNGSQRSSGIYSRAYYITMGSENTTATYIPDVLQMVNGYPAATTPTTFTTQAQADTYMASVYWDCGQAGGAPKSPKSPFPYSCAKWKVNTGNLVDDGLVGHVNFPACLTTNAASYDNLETPPGPFYAPPGVSNLNNNLTFDSNAGAVTTGSCSTGYQQIPQISIRMHTLLEKNGTTTEPIFASGSSASQLPSCFSVDLSGPCTNVTPLASDVRFGFAGDANPTSQGPYFTYHGDYMQMWQQSIPPNPDNQALNLDDIQEDCLFGANAQLCGFITNSSSLPG